MIKLSQRAWNNVLIVSMLSLIMLFNLSSDFLNSESDDASIVQRLVPADMLISTIEFENGKIERVGQGWRIESDSQVNQHPEDIIHHWQQAEINIFEQNVEWADSLPKVTLWFIGQSEPVEYQFLQLADKTLIKIDQHTYQLTGLSYQMLIPAE